MNPEDLIGLTVETADSQAREDGFYVRVIEEDGQGLAIDDDARFNRINVRILNGVVISIRGIF